MASRPKIHVLKSWVHVNEKCGRARSSAGASPLDRRHQIGVSQDKRAQKVEQTVLANGLHGCCVSRAFRCCCSVAVIENVRGFRLGDCRRRCAWKRGRIPRHHSFLLFLLYLLFLLADGIISGDETERCTWTKRQRLAFHVRELTARGNFRVERRYNSEHWSE